ncbi:hypothetical protein A9Q87_02635 [Flavobacteriales bacterium 34_180_T64]|nr:hypothetical protein A9Q87_02635 [Flavobacteriales bacterium 34_180_T64]
MINPNWIRYVITFTSGWIISLVLWRLLRIDEIKAYLVFLHVNFSSLNFILFISLVSLIAGLTFGSVQYYDDFVIRRKSSFITTLFKSFISHLIIMSFLYGLIFLAIKLSKINSNLEFSHFIRSPLIIINFIYSLIINAIIVIIIHLNKLLGRGNLLKLLTGKFYRPKEEYRVFMFIDLQSSTEIAERLGHISYSKLIQDCFYDLSVFEKSKAEIYQYVGDEAVLTWKFHKNTSLNTLIGAFFQYKKEFELKSKYYMSEYGVVPIFKAGMHLGEVTVVEVGSLKREIAYHGDTLNITSRIQAQCKVFEKEFLISQTLFDVIDDKSRFEYETLKEVLLRGKKESTMLISVSKKTADNITRTFRQSIN